MPAELLTIYAADEEAAVTRAAMALREGRVIALPTETVYGLAVRADDAEAMARLAAIKGRDANKPFQRLLARVSDAGRYNVALEGPARILAAKLWPGPLTLIVPAAGGGTIGLRVPDHPAAQAILAAADVAVAGTSANLAGGSPCLTAAEVVAQFGEVLALIVDAPPPPRGMVSTVVEVRGGQWRIVREGALSRAEIENALRTEKRE